MAGDPRMAASPTPLMPTPSISANSPLSLTTAQAPVPPLAIKPSLGPLSPALSSPLGIVTQKEWVVPPRPKPGRKPAVDNPQTKRKAQNRAAQRAFRERRAARVGELEERIREMEEEDAARMKEMEVQVSRLQHDVERFKGEVVAWKERCEVLDRSLEQERKEKESISGSYNALRKTYGARDSVPTQIPPQSKAADPPYQQGFQEEIELIGCGNCTKDSHCECVAQAIDIPNLNYPADDFSSSSKRPHSPRTTAETIKRLRNKAGADSTDLETDFTSLYSTTKRTAQSNVSPSADSEPPASAINSVIPTRLSTVENDMCGFCRDGTPCICADLSISIPQPDNNKPQQAHTPLPKFTPPPSDTDVILPQLVLPPLQSTTAATAATAMATASCINGPGTCAQCRADPNSTLFCKTLAAIRNNSDNNKTDSQTPLSGCCGGSAAGAGCCRDPSNSEAVMLSCADTYQTLSRHPGYELASDQFGSWLNRLNASSVSAAAAATGRPAMEVEAASVMGVLKLFDRRFGRG
ncbi:MAG: hypothetical protein M1813_003659 [Trichoglossum hirsutum]|nr:MAG: hypothetical protein M1813_003659 [Trichoglossum hirsutum]